MVAWASDNTGAVIVNANGDITGIEAGTAIITVTTENGAFTDQVAVTVTQAGPGTYYATRLSGSPTERYCLAKSLSVMPGDVVDIEVYAKYIDDDPQNWTPLLNNLIAAISIPSGGIFIDGGQPGSLGNETLPFTPLNNDSEPGVAPKAYLNYIIMDRDFNKIVNAGAKPVTTAAREYGQNGQHERLFFDDIVVREAGYMYIYLSNEGEELVDVFFDDLKVTHQKSPIVEAQDYYPFGLTFNQYTRESAVPNRWKFQGQEHVDDLGLNWDSFKWRNNQPDIGRFFNVDPLADKYVYNSPYAFSENKVISHVELEGLEAQGYLEKEFYNAEQAVRNVPNRIKEGLKSAGNVIAEMGATAGKNLYSLVGWVHDVPKESTNKKQKGDGVHIVDDSGSGGPDQQYLPRADPEGDNSTMEKSFLDGLIHGSKSDVPTATDGFGERTRNVAEGIDKAVTAADNVNNSDDKDSQLHGDTTYTTKREYRIDENMVYRQGIYNGDTTWIPYRKIRE